MLVPAPINLLYSKGDLEKLERLLKARRAAPGEVGSAATLSLLSELFPGSCGMSAPACPALAEGVPPLTQSPR